MGKSKLALAAVLLCTLACNKKEDGSGGGADGAPAASGASSATAAGAGWTKGQPVDAAVIEKLGLAVAGCKVQSGNGFGLDSSCAALKTWDEAHNSLPWAESSKLNAVACPKLLTNAAPAVRTLATTCLSSVGGTDVTGGELIATAMGTESDPAVLGNMVRMAWPSAAKSPKIAAAILAAAGHADKFVRFHAAVVLGGLTGAKLDGSAAKMMELAEKDPEALVRDVACEGLGYYGDAALPLLDKLTKDAAAPAFKSCFVGLMTQWVSYPFFDTNSEKAYKLSLQRIGQKPHNDALYSGLGKLDHLADVKSAAAVDWHKKNAWFKAEVLVKTLGDLVTDPVVGYLVKSSALDAAVANGATKKDLEGWRKTYGDKPDGAQAAIVKMLDKAIAK